jgi:hypothetical protein
MVQRRIAGAALAAVLVLPERMLAGDAPLVKTDWAGFQAQVARRKLAGRDARIALVSGGEIKANVIRVEDDGIVVPITKATKQWAAGKETAKVPRDGVANVRFSGTVGKAGLIGGLAGLGLGALVAGAGAAGMGNGNCEGSVCGVALAAIPVNGVTGWLIGRGFKSPAPWFFIQPPTGAPPTAPAAALP